MVSLLRSDAYVNTICFCVYEITKVTGLYRFVDWCVSSFILLGSDVMRIEGLPINSIQIVFDIRYQRISVIWYVMRKDYIVTRFPGKDERLNWIFSINISVMSIKRYSVNSTSIFFIFFNPSFILDLRIWMYEIIRIKIIFFCNKWKIVTIPHSKRKLCCKVNS